MEKKKQKVIAYSCAGEGRGHATGMIAVSQLLSKDYKIVFFAPSTVIQLVQEAFSSNPIYEIPSLNFAMEEGKINLTGTIKINSKQALSSYRVVRNIAKQMEDEGVEAVVSDFEPFTALAANYNQIPLLHLNHPGIVLRRFSLRPDAVVARAGAGLMMPPAQRTLITSFFEGEVGPIIRKEIRHLKPETKNHFLIYVKENTKKIIEKIENKFPQYEFCYFPDPQKDFVECLRTCKAVIAPGGHQMISEALHLNKPILVFPLENQYEQRLNAKMLNLSGRGLRGSINDVAGSIDQFIKWIEHYPTSHKNEIRFCFKDDTPKAVSEIKKFIKEFCN